MRKESLYIKSVMDGLNLYTTVFTPEGDIEGIVQISHGMVEHQVYYYDMMEYFANRGYVSVVHDHRGHGKSVKDDEDLGFFGDEKAESIVEDLHQLSLFIKGKFPGVPLYLFGHSMGSLVVRKYIKKYDEEITKLVVCESPSINKFARAGHLLAKAVKSVKGDHYRSRFLNRMALTDKPSDQWLSVNADYTKKYARDKYCTFIFTTNGFVNLTKLMMDVYSKKGWILKNPNLPIFFIAGSEDIVIKNERKWKESIEFLRRIGYVNIEAKLYPKFRHAIFMDGGETVYKDILEFIAK